MAKGYNRMPSPAGGSGGMMGQIKKMQEQLAAVQAQLAEETTTASVGGGAVKVIMTGDQRCKGIEISADLLKDSDPEMLQDIILSAVNLALDQSRQMAEERMGPLAGGIPGLGF